MFIPRYWSEAKSRATPPSGEPFMVRRFGWSSATQDDADVHARQRLEEALAVARAAGPQALKTFTRLERKAAYAGAEGLPIREEIVRELPELNTVLTRNSYGAVCLNTTDALFVDIDKPWSRAFGKGCATGCVLLPILFVCGVWLLDWSVIRALGGAVLGAWILGWLSSRWAAHQEAKEPRFVDLLEWVSDQALDWCHKRPDWRLVVYETPAGARVMATHATFEASSDATSEFMTFMAVDPLYARMCHIQKCFRARVTPKPWRTRLKEHYTSGGTWPVTDPAKLRRRAAWVALYEGVFPEYAACRFIKTVGHGATDPHIEAIRTLHDDMCNATSRLPLA